MSAPAPGERPFAFDNVLPRNLDHQAMLRAVFAAHFVLSSVVLLGAWTPLAFAFYSGFLLAGLLWAMSVPAADSELPLLKCLFVDGAAIVLDIFVWWSSYGSSNAHGGFDGFALFALIVQLLLRPLALIVLLRIRNERLRLRYDNWDNQPPPQTGGQQRQFDGPSVASAGGYSIGSYDVPPATGGAYLPPAYFGAPSYGEDTKPIAP